MQLALFFVLTMSYLPPMEEARYLCDFIEFKMAELAALKASMAPTTGPLWLAAPPPPPPPPPAAQGEQGLETEGASIVEEPTAFLALLEDDEGWSADESWEAMDGSNVDKMLASSVKPSTAAKYGRIWDKWVVFATSHSVDIMPSEIRALEIFIADTAELSGSAEVAATAAAAVAHFCALEGFVTPFGCPRFGKILRGIRSSFGKAATPRHCVFHAARAPRHLEGMEISSSLGPLLSAAAERGRMF
jgi:hypothetical protein